MGLRSVSGITLFILILAIIFFAPFWALPLAISLVSALAVHEILYTTRFITEKRMLTYAMVFAFLIPVWAFFGSGDISGVCGITVYVLILFIEGLTGAKGVTFEKISGMFFASVVIPYLLSSIIRMDEMAYNKVILIFPILGAFSSDVFALFTGKLLGKRKLCPEISPKKTVEGSIGGLIMAPITLLVYGGILSVVYDYTLNYPILILYGFAAAFAGQLGDLSMSFIKRQFHIKDFGDIIPGHGGILDRFDSVLFAAPVIEILIHVLPAITK